MQQKDWTGNSKSVYTPLGSSHHSIEDRELYDYYATEPRAAEMLLKLEKFSNIWECACGAGHLSKVFEKAGYNIKSSDLVDRGYGTPSIDFLDISNQFWGGILLRIRLTNMPKNLF